MKIPSSRLFVLIIILAAVVAYIGNLDSYFVKDDLSIGILSGGTHEFSWTSWFRNLFWPIDRTLDDIFRPATALTWVPDYLLFGPDPVGFHLWNVLIHALNGVIIYWLVNRLTGFRNPLAGFFAGLLFVLYPLHLEAVLWMTQRFVLMGLMFSLLALLCWHVYLHRRERRHLILTWVFVGLACLSKELGITLPAPLLFMTLFMGPTHRKSDRMRLALRVVVTGSCVVGAYFGLRYAVFGRFLGAGYAGFPSMEAYAEATGVFGKYGRSLIACVVPGNVEFVGGAGRFLFIALHGFFAGVALLSLLRAGRSSAAWRFTGFSVLFTLVTFLPTWQIFMVEPSLINSRFAYHPICMVVVAAAVLVVDPWRPNTGRGKSLLRIGLPAMLAVVYAIVLQCNLQAYDGGSLQVRRIQEVLLKESKSAPADSLVVVFGVPFEYRGCPTVDSYLPALLRPPLVRVERSAYPFVASLEASWHLSLAGDAQSLAAIRREGQPLRFFTVSRPAYPLAVHPLFGAREPAWGQRPATLVAPSDGTILPCPDPDPAREPEFHFQAPLDAREFVLHLFTGAPGGSVSTEPDQQHLRFRFRVGDKAARVGSTVVYVLSGGDRSDSPTLNPWPTLASTGFLPPLPVMWRIETLDEAGEPVGLSASFRLVLIPGPR